MKIFYILIALNILSLNRGYSSPQFPDLLIYKNDTISTYNLLLEKYFNQIEKYEDVEGQLFGLNFRQGATFNCWRGYQAIYKIEKDSLFLEHITGCGEYYHTNSIDVYESKKTIREIFGTKVKNGRVLIDWYSGNFSIPQSNTTVIRWDGFFYNTFKEEILFEISKGKIINTSKIVNYIDDLDRINREDKKNISDVLFEEIQKIKWKNIDKFDCSEIYLVKIGKNGLVKEVIMPEYQTEAEIDKYWDSKREYNYCIRTLRKGLKKLKFDIIMKAGNPIAEDIQIEIWFNEDGTIENWTD